MFWKGGTSITLVSVHLFGGETRKQLNHFFLVCSTSVFLSLLIPTWIYPVFVTCSLKINMRNTTNHHAKSAQPFMHATEEKCLRAAVVVTMSQPIFL